MYLKFIMIVVVIKSELNQLLLSGIFEDDFIEERRQGLEAFVNRCDICIYKFKILVKSFVWCKIILIR